MTAVDNWAVCKEFVRRELLEVYKMLVWGASMMTVQNMLMHFVLDRAMGSALDATMLWNPNQSGMTDHHAHTTMLMVFGWGMGKHSLVHGWDQAKA